MSKGDSCCPIDNGDNIYDLAVIGAGSAGFAAIIHASEMDAKVLFIGEGTIGGTCVNTGCIPSKALIRAAETLHQSHSASRFQGIESKADLKDWSSLMAQKDRLVQELREEKYIYTLGKQKNITYLNNRAILTNRGILVDGEVYQARKILITTGASPSIPDIPGISNVSYLTSTSALALEKLPFSMIVIGGGAIGCEIGQMFARLGVKVTLVCRHHLLPEVEPEISELLTRYLREEGIDVRCGVAYKAIEEKNKSVLLTLQQANGTQETIQAEKVLLATGRRPNTKGLGLEEVGVIIKANQGVQVDEYLRTTNQDIYAAGDVTSSHMYVYMAAYEGKLAVENALNNNTRPYDTSFVPAVTFTDPQVATVGLTEQQALKENLPIKAAILGMDQVARALVAQDTRGLIKLIINTSTQKILGVHILAPEAGDSIQTGALALKHGYTVTDLSQTIFPYLTTVEGLRLAALSFSKDIHTLSCCAS